MNSYQTEVISLCAEHELTEGQAARRLGWGLAEVVAAVDQYHAAGRAAVGQTAQLGGIDVRGPRP